MTNFLKINRIKKLVIASFILGSSYISYTKVFDIKKDVLSKGIDTSFKCWMPMNSITDKTSKQYALIKNAKAMNYGIANYQNHYLVALGKRYGEIGDEVIITLDTGVILKVFLADFKKTYETIGWGLHPISKNRNCMLEFIVDPHLIAPNVKSSGDLSSIYPGQIVKIENKRLK